MSSDPLCTRFESICWSAVIPIFWTPTLIISIAFLYVYITAYSQRALKTSKLLFSVGIAFLISITLTCVSAITRAESFCHDSVLSTWFLNLYVVFYALQACLLTTSLFIRLSFIFKETEFKLSNRSIYVYIVITVVSFIITVLYITSRVSFKSADFEAILVGISFLLYLGTLFWINYLFVARLLRVYESCKDTAVKNRGLKHIATKNAILCVMSSATIIVFAMCEILRIQVPSMYTVMIDFFSLQWDLTTNMLSILLGYRRFDAWYRRLCGCCHRGCGACCIRCVGDTNKNEEMMEMEMEMQTDQDSKIQSATSGTGTGATSYDASSQTVI